MRKILTALACVGVTLSLLPAFMAPAHALDVSIGPAVWYAWWTPAFWKEWSRGDADDTVTKRDFNSTFLFGPALAVSFSPKWSLTGVFMWTGWYRAEKTKIDVGDNQRSEDSLDISKYDLDTALNYTINRYCKLFGGVKYQGYTYRDRGKDYDLTTGVLLDSYSNRLYWRSIGPGAGIGVTVPLSQSVFLLVNVSGIFLYSAFEGMEDDFDNDQKWVYTSYGANGSLSLAWYVDSMTTTISLGARYQYLHNNRNSRRSDAITDPDDTDPFDGNADRFYGLTFSAVYSFEL
ncbi:MAG TPA: hypothetical protein PLZ78_12595 [Spirochaetota bacterium]|jgi:hypothetical protein|nr:hypothetical protein [Spirochaetota bacterium]